MRVLWFTNTPSNYLKGTNSYNGGGWISSLETELLAKSDVELGIAFLLNGHPQKIIRGKVIYYPIYNPYTGSISAKVIGKISSAQRKQQYFISEYLRVIKDFHPDIIQIFGTEQDYGLVAEYVTIPILVHLQGLLIPCLTAFFPPGYNLRDYVWSDYNPFEIYKRWYNYVRFRNNAKREEVIIKNIRHFMGRTDWDSRMVQIYNPHATYDYCSEILRECFYFPCIKELPSSLIIVTTISCPLYKGFDIVLKCANILKNQMKVDFEWKVYGNVDPQLVEKKENILSSEVNVLMMGVVSQEQLKETISRATLYVHTSYIDNSPNSVCEAQILGCTVVGQDVGGMPSLISNGETGILVPSNDPYQMAYTIRDLYSDPEKNLSLGRRAAEVARNRHDKERIICDLVNIYRKYTNV